MRITGIAFITVGIQGDHPNAGAAGSHVQEFDSCKNRCNRLPCSPKE